VIQTRDADSNFTPDVESDWSSDDESVSDSGEDASTGVVGEAPFTAKPANSGPSPLVRRSACNRRRPVCMNLATRIVAAFAVSCFAESTILTTTQVVHPTVPAVPQLSMLDPPEAKTAEGISIGTLRYVQMCDSSTRGSLRRPG